MSRFSMIGKSWTPYTMPNLPDHLCMVDIALSVGDSARVVLCDSHWKRIGVIARSAYIVVGE